MRKKILVVSDNISLCIEFKKIISKRKFVDIDYSTSPFSNKSLFDYKLKEKVKQYNLKNTEDINIIINNDYDLIFSIHCKQLFPESIVKRIKCINVHPGYNPINRGWYPQVFAIINDLPIGATIHEIDNQLDNGLIIARDFVKKDFFDTSETLYNKIMHKEIELLKNNIDIIISGNYTTIAPEGKGNLFLKKDFKDLCELNLDEKLTGLEFINKLRALSHGDFKNAYFIDPKTHKKIYVNLNLKLES